MKSITANNADFKHFVEEIKSKIHSAHASALKAVNKELIALYSDIGRIIVQRQERFGWAKVWWKAYRKNCKVRLRD